MAKYLDSNGLEVLKDELDKRYSGGGTGSVGVSPTIEVKQTTTGVTITTSDINGTTSATVTNGINGKDGIAGKDGATGATGSNGIDGTNGLNGADGYSPTITINSNTDTEYTLNITDKNGTITTPNLKGAKGADGSSGSSGGSSTSSGVVYSETEHAVGTWIDGRTIYQRTFAIPCTGTTMKTLQTTNLGVKSTDYDFIVDYKGILCLYQFNGSTKSTTLNCVSAVNEWINKDTVPNLQNALLNATNYIYPFCNGGELMAFWFLGNYSPDYSKIYFTMDYVK